MHSTVEGRLALSTAPSKASRLGRMPHRESLSFPGEGGGAEDGGVGLLELGVDELDLVLPEREDVVVHRTEDRLGEELLASGETAEENDGLRRGERDEVGESLAEEGSGIFKDLDGKGIAFLGGLIDIL